MQDHLDYCIELVNKGQKSFSEALEELIAIEKKNNQLRAENACVKTANFPFIKMLDDFEFNFQLGINRKEILKLSNLGFIDRKENILFVGTSGVGKTHLATAIGIARRYENHCTIITTNMPFSKWGEIFGFSDAGKCCVRSIAASFSDYFHQGTVIPFERKTGLYGSAG